PPAWCNSLIEANNKPLHSRGEVTIMNTFLVVQQTRLLTLIARLNEREEGQDMVEYALLAALISIVAIAIIILIGPYLKDLFQDVVNGLGTA
ncbi:MAG: hypothetical protein M3Z66_17375, partial [Chloroflexota bacterium]|nr:hypothetical protein [Chloroflexota bacterium]